MAQDWAVAERAFARAVLLCGWLLGGGQVLAQADQTGASGLTIPRYVSLKSDRVNLRKGPGLEYPTAWVFRRAGMPVEVIKEFEGWRQVRDAEGTAGWVLQTLLSGRRTALIEPWSAKEGVAIPQVALKRGASEDGADVAVLEAGVLVNVHACDKAFCEVTTGAFKGYIAQKRLWGVYPGEVVK